MTSSEGSPSSVGETEKNKRKRVFLFFSARLRVDGGKKRASGTSRLGVVLATATPKSMARSRFLGRGSFRVHRTGSDCFVSFVFALKKNFFLPDQSASAERTLFRWRPATSLFLFRLAIVPSVRSGAIMERKTNGLQLGVEDFSREREREREREFLSKLRHRPRCRYRVLPSFFFQKMLQLDF